MEQANLIEWSYEDSKNRGPIWYTIALSILLGLIIWGILSGQYGLSFAVMLVGGMYYYFDNDEDELTRVAINERGIGVQNRFYDFGKIAGFFLIYSGDQAVYLRLILKKNTIKQLDIRVDNSIAQELRETLASYIPESEQQDISMVDRLIMLLKL